MKRPKGKLFALLAIFAALVLVTASGAFTSVEADRTANIDVADDADAFLRLAPNASGNGAYATQNNGQLQIDLTSTTNGGQGVNPNALTKADHVFDIQNQGTQTVDVSIQHGGANDNVVSFYHSGYTNNWGSSGSIEETTVTLDPGQKVSVGIEVDTRGYSGGDMTEAVTVTAQAP
jgi:hypothetical protein